jgi:transposase
MEAKAEVMGIDLGDRFSNYAVIDSRGRIIEEDRVATRRESMERLLSGHTPIRVVIETGTHSPWVSRLAAAAGHEVIVANARKVKLISANKKKRDRVDARYLVRLGRADVELLHPVRHRSEQTQQHRSWLLAREAAVRSRTKLINHVRGIVKSLGERLPSCSAEAFVKQARPCVPAAMQPVLLPLLPLIEMLSETIRQYDKAIAALSRRHYPVVERLQQVSGVGPLTALAFVLTLEDPHRFRRSRTVGAYLGLVPGTHESGDQVPQMHITKEGDVMLRCLLINAAHYILGRYGPDCDLRRHGLRIAQRGGKIAKKRAVVAVARKLAVLLHKLWVDQLDYDPLHASGRLAQAA